MTDFPPFKLSFPEESVRITANPRAVITDNDLPDIKLKTQPVFPASVIDGTGVDVVKQNGTYQFNIAFDDFAPPVLSLPDQAHQNVLTWNSVTQVYSLVPISLTAGVSEAPADGNVYGRQNLGWTNAWASPVLTGNPTAPTASPGDNDTSVATTAFVAAAVTAIPVSVRVIHVQKFTASGTYTPNANMTSCIIECVGGGGGGGAAVSAGSTIFAGAGGAAGGYSRLLASAATIGASKTVTIGALGAGGAVGSNSGSAGGQTSVGSICVANGGGGGTFASAVSVASGGAPGATGTGDVAFGGSAGGNGFYNSTNNTITGPSGVGGSSFFGGGGQGTGVSTGNAAVAPGGGGSGGYNNGAGGNGAAGLVIITEYCSQ